jgi:hypothetical protein
MQRIAAEARQAVFRAQERQAALANRSRRHVEFKVGDRVWLNAHAVRLPKAQGAVAKLLAKRWGPYTVSKVISSVAYRLDLPPHLKLHPVFHVSQLLEVNLPPDGDLRVVNPPPPEEIDGEEHYTVDAFLAERTVSGYRQYLVSWLGYGPEHNEWCFEVDLEDDLDPDTFKHLRDTFNARPKPAGAGNPRTRRRGALPAAAAATPAAPPATAPAVAAGPASRRSAERARQATTGATPARPATRATPAPARSTRRRAGAG